MNNIEWKEGAVCYADGEQWYVNGCSENKKYQLKNSKGNRKYSFYGIINYSKDLQLNEPRQGDYIPKSELDTEQKYNDAVEVFGLFGFGVSARFSTLMLFDFCYLSSNGDVGACSNTHLSSFKSRPLTYNQLMAIGKLKRLMNERDKVNTSEKPNSCDKPKLATQYLNECIDVQKQRGEQYDSTGTGERSFAAAASAFNSLTGKNIKGSDVCLLLTCVKAVRQYSNPNRLHEDSLLDGVSYLSLWAEELNKEIN